MEPCVRSVLFFVIYCISDPDCNITVGIMFWFAYFSVVFCIHKIHIRRRKQWCVRLTKCLNRTLIIQLCQGKYGFPFYGTFNKLLICCLLIVSTVVIKFRYWHRAGECDIKGYWIFFIFWFKRKYASIRQITVLIKVFHVAFKDASN